MSDQKYSGLKGNRNAAKATGDKLTGAGRTTVELGDLKARAIKQAKADGKTLSAWIRDVVEKHC